MNDMMMLIALVFGAVAMIGFVVGRVLTGGNKDNRLRDRLVANPVHDPGPSSITKDGASSQPQPGASGMVSMVVCVEAGLTVDAAMHRVGQELHIAHPAISREFAITYMETRVGLSRSDALKNMGNRTGSAPLQSLASMLVQADRFGTSIANA